MRTQPHALSAGVACAPMTSTVGSASISSSMASRSVSHIIFSFFAAARTGARAAARLAAPHCIALQARHSHTLAAKEGWHPAVSQRAVGVARRLCSALVAVLTIAGAVSHWPYDCKGAMASTLGPRWQSERTGRITWSRRCHQHAAPREASACEH